MKYMQDWTDPARQVNAWARIDGQLCGLVDHLHAMGYRHTLEAELRLRPGVGGGPEECNFSRLLPEFREKGVVTVVDVVCSNQVLHSSTHNC